MGSHVQTLRVRSSGMSQWVLFLIRFLFSPRGSLYQRPAALSHPPEPCALTLWLGPQTVSPGRELSSQLCPVTLGKRFDFSDSGFAPLKMKSLARMPSRVPALPVLARGREVLLVC